MLKKYFVRIHKFSANNTLSLILIPFSVSLFLPSLRDDLCDWKRIPTSDNTPPPPPYIGSLFLNFPEEIHHEVVNGFGYPKEIHHEAVNGFGYPEVIHHEVVNGFGYPEEIHHEAVNGFGYPEVIHHEVVNG